MKIRFVPIFAIVFMIFLSACSAPEFFTFKPDRDKVETEEGTEIAFVEDDIMFTNIEFEEEAEGKFIFYVFAFNKTDENVNVDPSQIKMIAFDENKKPLKKLNTFLAYDPDLMVEKFKNDIENRETEHEISTGLNFIFALVSTAVDLSNDNDNDVAEVFENAAVFADNQIHEEIDYSNDVDYLKSQKRFWKNEVLPKIDLNSDEDIGGLVFLPAVSEASFIKIIIPFEKTKHTYFFKKEKISVQ